MPSLDVGTEGSRFVGRAQELEELEAWLSQPLPITIVGTAGIGKSRLAEELCARWSGESAVAAMANERDEAGCIAKIARALDLAGATEADVTRALAARGQMVLWLDDADHAIEFVASFVADLRVHAPEVRLLVTSRERLRLRHERLLVLEPLSSEQGAGSEAYALLEERLAAQTGVVLDEERKLALLRWVEGIPLAIELAAARASLLGGALDGEGRLALLRGGYRDGAQRHTTLQRAIAWSWDLLTEQAKVALSEASVFRDAFDPVDAEAILTEPAQGTVRDVLQSLVDRSFIRLVDGRLRLFDAVREFARAERASDHAAAMARLDLRVAEDASADESDVLHVAGRVDAGSTALSLEAQVRVRLRACSVLRSAGPAEQILVLTEGVDRSELAVDLAAALDVARAEGLRMVGRFEAAREMVRATLDNLGGRLDDASRVELWFQSALASHAQRDLDAAAAQYEQVLELGPARDTAFTQGRVLANLGAVAHDRGDLDDAERWYERALAALGGNQRSLGAVRANLALLQQERGDLVLAEGSFQRALEDLDAASARHLASIHQSNLGTLRLELNEAEAACALHDQALPHLRRMGDQRSTVLGLCRRAAAHASLDAVHDAETDLEEAARRAFGCSDPLLDALVRLHRAWLSLARARAAASDDERARWTDDARRRMDEAGEPSFSDDARTARRLLERALGALDGSSLSAFPSDAMLVGIEARCIRLPTGAWSDLRRHLSQRRMLDALVSLGGSGERLDMEALREVAWPGERIRRDAARNRIHVTLSKLRKRGLEGILCRDDAGYFLSPDTRVERVALTEPPA